MPAKTGIQNNYCLDSHFRGNDISLQFLPLFGDIYIEWQTKFLEELFFGPPPAVAAGALAAAAFCPGSNKIKISPATLATFQRQQKMLAALEPFLDKTMADLEVFGYFSFPRPITLMTVTDQEFIRSVIRNDSVENNSVIKTLRAGAIALVLHYQRTNNGFVHAQDTKAPLNQRSAMVVVNHQKFSKLGHPAKKKNALMHEFSHATAWLSGFIDPQEKVFAEIDQLSRTQGISFLHASKLGPELHAYLDQITDALNRQDDRRVTRGLLIDTVVTLSALVFLNRHAMYRKLKKADIKLTSGKNAAEAMEQSYLAALALENSRIASINKALIRHGVPRINPDISAQNFRAIARSLGAKIPPLTQKILEASNQ